MGGAPARWKPDLTEWWSLSQRGERIREGKSLFVVAANSLPGKVLCRGHYFQLSTKSFWSQAWSSWDEISQWLLFTLKCSSKNLNQKTDLHQHDTNQLKEKIIPKQWLDMDCRCMSTTTIRLEPRRNPSLGPMLACAGSYSSILSEHQANIPLQIPMCKIIG